MLEFIKRFLSFAEFFKNRNTLHHSRQGFVFEQAFALTSQDSKDIAGFFERFLQSHRGKMQLNVSLLKQFEGWEAFVNQFGLWAEEYFLTSQTGIQDFLCKYREFDLFDLQEWARTMGYNMSQVKRFINFLEIFGLIQQHKNRFHVIKQELPTSESYGQKCLYFLPNLEVILFNPGRYQLVITLLHLFEFRKMNYEIVFHINQDHLFKVIQDSRELEEFTSLFGFSLNEIPENIEFLSGYLQDQLKKIQFEGAGLYFRINDIHVREHLEQFLKQYQGHYYRVKDHLFVHLDIVEDFYHFLDENKFSYYKSDGIQENKIKEFLGRMDTSEIEFIWIVFCYFSMMLQRFRLFNKVEKHFFDELFQYLSLIYKSEHDLSEKELNQGKKQLRQRFERCYSENVWKMGRKMVMENKTPSLSPRFWRKIRHALFTDRPVRVLFYENEKKYDRMELNGYIVAVNQLGMVLKSPKKTNKTVFLYWDSIKDVVC